MINNSQSHKFDFSDDIRFKQAVSLFNSQKWYEAHDLFEEIWHETSGPERKIIQAVLQIAVAQLHLDRGNIRGATILYGEALGRLKDSLSSSVWFDIDNLISTVDYKLSELQLNNSTKSSLLPYINIY